MHLLRDSEIALAFAAACAAKATLLLALAWILPSLLRKQSAAVRHRLWALAILSSLSLPVCTLLLPAWRSGTLAGAAAFWDPPNLIAAKSGPENLTAMIVNAT